MMLVALLLGLALLTGGLLIAKKRAGTARSEASPLDYDQAISLDAEDLAEGGVRAAYGSLLPLLRKYTPQPLAVEERLDEDAAAYVVTAGERDYLITGPGLDDDESWGRATVALFNIVNRQLEQSEYRFYALNGGNDLFGIFLSSREASAAQRALSKRSDWPYLPADEPPWYGQFR